MYTCIYEAFVQYYNCFHADHVSACCPSGMEVNTPDGIMKVLLVACVDLPAQAKLLNMKQYNGAFGCYACEDKGVPRHGCRTARDWPPRSPLRTHDTVFSNAGEATRLGSAVSQLCICTL